LLVTTLSTFIWIVFLDSWKCYWDFFGVRHKTIRRAIV
jgi:hypothetical protein